MVRFSTACLQHRDDVFQRLADGIVREHLTKNIYGFEYLIAPYTIAHLKLSQYLRDKGHPLQDQERLQVFLTNTLEPVEPQGNLLMPALAEEVKGAQAVKDKLGADLTAKVAEALAVWADLDAALREM